MEQRALEGPAPHLLGWGPPAGTPLISRGAGTTPRAARVEETVRTRLQGGPWTWDSCSARFLQRPRVTGGTTEAVRDEGP